MQEQPKEQWEMPADEIAGQAGKAATATGPYGEGRQAARDGKPKSANPFQKGNGQRKPWSDGWNAETSDMAAEATLAASEGDKAPGGAIKTPQEGEGSEGWQIREATPEEAAKLEASTPRLHRAPKPEQQILPGTEGFIPKYDPVIHAAAKSYAEARDTRMTATKLEVERKTLLLGLLTKDGLAGYQYEEVSVEITTDVKLKVRITGEEEE